MKIIVIIALTIALSGCIIARSPYQPSILETKENIANQSQKWEPLVVGSDLKTDKNYKYYPSEMLLSNSMLLRGKEWNTFLKKYIESIPEQKRNAVLRGLTRFYKEFDKVDKVIKFEPLRYRSGPYSGISYVSLVGDFTKKNANAFLKIRYIGNSWVFAEKITVVADDFTWTSPNIKFYRDNTNVVLEYAYLDLKKPEYRKVANKIASSREVIIRLRGEQYYRDIKVTERMKQDISEMLKAIDAINKDNNKLNANLIN